MRPTTLRSTTIPMLSLYNTLTGRTEVFQPLDPPRVRMYHCGPTVYDYPHIGNLRAYVFSDVLRRTLEWNGYEITQVINITDVGHLTSDADDGEDKMTKALKRLGKPLTLSAMREVGEHYTAAFLENLRALNVKLPHHLPRASDHIADCVTFIKVLEGRGVTYQIRDGVYFDIKKFSAYGRLGSIDREGLKAGARVAVHPEKKDPSDFALWKRGEVGWESPWGRGFPGWHLECSVMSVKYLGQPFDIHTGGVEHIPIHHQNEIAQSEVAAEKPLALFWLHGEHLLLEGEKMAKSEENVLTLKELMRRNMSPASYRYWLLTAHYRTQMTWSRRAMAGAAHTLKRLIGHLGEWPTGGTVDRRYRKKFTDRLNDDLDTPGALSVVWTLTRDAAVKSADKKRTILEFDRVLGLKLDEAGRTPRAEIPTAIKEKVAKREEARREKNWAIADALREEIKALGYDVRDTDDGPVVTPKEIF